METTWTAEDACQSTAWKTVDMKLITKKENWKHQVEVSLWQLQPAFLMNLLFVAGDISILFSLSNHNYHKDHPRLHCDIYDEG